MPFFNSQRPLPPLQPTLRRGAILLLLAVAATSPRLPAQWTVRADLHEASSWHVPVDPLRGRSYLLANGTTLIGLWNAQVANRREQAFALMRAEASQVAVFTYAPQDGSRGGQQGTVQGSFEVRASVGTHAQDHLAFTFGEAHATASVATDSAVVTMDTGLLQGASVTSQEAHQKAEQLARRLAMPLPSGRVAGGRISRGFYANFGQPVGIWSRPPPGIVQPQVTRRVRWSSRVSMGAFGLIASKSSAGARMDMHLSARISPFLVLG